MILLSVRWVNFTPPCDIYFGILIAHLIFYDVMLGYSSRSRLDGREVTCI